jgi:hypothetical protein
MTSRTPTCLQDAIAELLEAEEAHATRLQQMREALEKFGQHTKGCGWFDGGMRPKCTCGLTAALAASPEED